MATLWSTTTCQLCHCSLPEPHLHSAGPKARWVRSQVGGSDSLLLLVLIRRSIRHIEGKVREMFGSRKPKDTDFDSKLRPKDSVQMDNRVRAFVECKEQWHMLRRRAVLESHISVPSRTTQAGIFDICHDDQRALFVHPQENPPDEAFQARIQSLSTNRQEYPGPLDCTQTTL